MEAQKGLAEADIKQRIELLNNFQTLLNAWLRRTHASDIPSLRSAINRDLRAAGMAVIQAGISKALSGPGFDRIDPFTNIFIELHGETMMVHAKDAVEQAIGLYTHMLANPRLMLNQTKDALDLEGAIERALRPSFRKAPPKDEYEVQDAVQNILNALGIQHTRDTEVAPVGGKSFKPDFVLEEWDMALEVKYTRGSTGPALIQEQMAADVAAYNTKWSKSLFVVYDNGTIADPYQFRLDNMRKLQTAVVIVKH